MFAVDERLLFDPGDRGGDVLVVDVLKLDHPPLERRPVMGLRPISIDHVLNVFSGRRCVAMADGEEEDVPMAGIELPQVGMRGRLLLAAMIPDHGGEGTPSLPSVEPALPHQSL